MVHTALFSQHGLEAAYTEDRTLSRQTTDIVDLARHDGRYGYRQVTRMLQGAGWGVNHKRVARIWRRAGLKVPTRRAGRWFNDASCVRLRPARPNHVWSHDFVRPTPMTAGPAACSTVRHGGRHRSETHAGRRVHPRGADDPD